MSKLNYFM